MEYVLGEGGIVQWQTSIDTDRMTGAPSTRCTAVCSATMPPRRAACGGNGSIAATRTTPGSEPEIWIAREGPAIVGQYATMPVQLSLGGREVQGSWGMDVMVAPERQRQGLGEVLFRTWDRNVGASLGLGLSDSSYRLFQKLRWPDVGPVPCFVKPLTRRALRRPNWPVARQPARLGADAAGREDRRAHPSAGARKCG